jgi:hypothetical protein
MAGKTTKKTAEKAPKTSVPRVGKPDDPVRKKSSKPRKAGRPLTFSVAIGERILDGLAGGNSLTKVCEDESLPDRHTVAGWVRRGAVGTDADLQAFAVGFVLACNVRVALLEDDFVQLVARIRGTDKLALMAGEAVRFKLEMDALKWYLGRFRQRRAEVDGFEDAVKRLEDAAEDAEESGGYGGRFVMKVVKPEASHA